MILKFPTRLLVTSALVGLCLGLPAMARVDKVSAIEVTFDLPAVTNKAAALRYTKVADDLTNAISALLVDRLSEEGQKIGIDLSEVELSHSYTDAIGAAETKLVGLVAITDVNDNSNFESYTLTVNIDQVKTFLPTTVDMTKLSASTNEYYNAVVQAFAANVVNALDK